MKKRCKKAFTLAEVLITLTILGVVAAIVIPTMMRNNGEAAKRTKMKKAIASYEKVVETMRINEGYQTVDAMKDDMNVAGCEKSRGYFKTKTVDSGDNCIFQASDGLWWNIKNIAQPIVVFEKGEANEYIKDGTYADKTLKDDDAESKKAFYLTVTQGTAAQGYAFIVNDPSGLANKALVYAKIISSSSDDDITSVDPFTTICTGSKRNNCTNIVSECANAPCMETLDGNGNPIISGMDCGTSETVFECSQIYVSEGASFTRGDMTFSFSEPVVIASEKELLTTASSLSGTATVSCLGGPATLSCNQASSISACNVSFTGNNGEDVVATGCTEGNVCSTYKVNNVTITPSGFPANATGYQEEFEAVGYECMTSGDDVLCYPPGAAFTIYY